MLQTAKYYNNITQYTIAQTRSVSGTGVAKKVKVVRKTEQLAGPKDPRVGAIPSCNMSVCTLVSNTHIGGDRNFHAIIREH